MYINRMSRRCQLIDFSTPSATCWLSQGAVLLDIRTREEYCQGHIPGAILISTPIPHPELTSRELTTLRDHLWYVLSNTTKSLNTPIVIYCKKGIRATIAQELIRTLGYTRVVVWGGVEEPPLNAVFANKKQLCQGPERWSR
jgi:phage shock protein E